MELIDAHTQSPAELAAAGALVLDNSADVLAMAAAVADAACVVLQFPKWTDGRAYSQAVLLRGRLRYAGEIRAIGDVLVDMLPLLRRCGFDTVQLRDDQNTATAQRILGSLPGPFPGHYQGDALGSLPVFGGPEAATRAVTAGAAP